MIHVLEKGRKLFAEGIKWYGRNTEGRANSLACLKAWMEFGINLRKGPLDISQMLEF